MKVKSSTKSLFSTISLVQMGLLTAIIAVLSQIAIPLPSGVPITLQTFAIALTAYILGWKAGTISVFVYILLGIVGVPVFTGFHGGIQTLFGKTGGFIIGFLFMALLCGLAQAPKKNVFKLILLSIIGLLSCHLCGILQFSFLTHMNFFTSATLVSLPYLIKDTISIILAYFISITIKKTLPMN